MPEIDCLLRPIGLVQSSVRDRIAPPVLKKRDVFRSEQAERAGYTGSK